MIYFYIVAYDQKTLADFATSHHHRGWNIVGANRFIVRIFSQSSGRHSNRKSNPYLHRSCWDNFTSRINRLDHIDGRHHRNDHSSASTIQAFNLDEIILLIHR